MTPLEKFIDDCQRICDVHDFLLAFDPSEEGGAGWLSYFGLLTDGGNPSDVLIRREVVRGNYDEAHERQTVLAKAVEARWNALPQALQYLRDVMRENAKLCQRITEMQDEQLMFLPMPRTVCEKEPKP